MVNNATHNYYSSYRDDEKMSPLVTQSYPEAQEVLKDVYLQCESAEENNT